MVPGGGPTTMVSHGMFGHFTSPTGGAEFYHGAADLDIFQFGESNLSQEMTTVPPI